ncbi:MAG: aminopeptidase [Mycoplasmoidaceae bacterium]|nr:MAG: aminopeptidase [Mycoplasmoidaceae bacterium]
MDKSLLLKYAKLVVTTGVNIQKGQIVSLVSSIAAYDLALLVLEECYKLGAKKVRIQWTDDKASLLQYKYENLKDLMDIGSANANVRNDITSSGGCYIRIVSDVPGILKDVDSKKLSEVTKNIRKELAPTMKAVTNSDVQWTIVAYPNVDWAKICFPKLSNEKALEKLTLGILNSVKIDKTSNPISNWKKHNINIHKRVDKMNKFNFKNLIFKNSLGTNITIDLVQNHVWQGGSGKANVNKAEFNANMPSEEIWCMPHKDNVNGIVYNTKPLNYNGNIIDGFKLVFKDGKIVSYSAKVGASTLKQLINSDDGSKSIGEVALVPYESPISQSGILFYSTLQDENASCHLAIGCSYPSNIKGGVKMTREELMKHGGNFSNEHVDFMFGSKDLSVVGTTYNGKTIQVFKNGNFVI